MPLLSSTYNPVLPFKNGHIATIYASKLRLVNTPTLSRARFKLNDGDFLDIDWAIPTEDSNKLIIMLHGLEGNSRRKYMMGCANYANQQGWAVAAVNFRGCSGEPNLKYHSYNAGQTADLDEVIAHVLAMNKYERIALVGFSLGANLLLKYLGEGNPNANEIYKGVAVSAPVSLKDSLARLEEPQNWLYRNVFLWTMKSKLRQKQKSFPEKISPEEINNINSLLDFDNMYTAPAHGYKDAYHYYEESSSLNYLQTINTPVYILNAKNDSFLSTECYPIVQAKQLDNIYLEIPTYGGHVGFIAKNNRYYSEYKILEFLNEE